MWMFLVVLRTKQFAGGENTALSGTMRHGRRFNQKIKKITPLEYETEPF